MKLSIPFVLSVVLRQTQHVLAVSTNVLPAPTWQPSEYHIHSSCNGTETLQLRRGLNEMILLAEHAKSHILQHGNRSTTYRKYFGQAPPAEPAGWYDRVVSADREDVLFRCDDPDRNCATQQGWAGHWRGSNATQETVICPLSFTTRKPLEAMCAFGYTVSDSPTNFYFGSDLLHRVWHVPRISLGLIEHYAENFDDVMHLAKTNSTFSVRDSDTLLYFALEVFSEIVVPGGCVGKKGNETVPTVTGTKTTVSSDGGKATGTASASASCHTHDDGVVHC